MPKIAISEKEKFFLEIQTSVGDLDMEGVYIWLSTIAMNFTSYFGQQKETKKLIYYLEITHSYTKKYPYNQLIMAQYVNALRNGILDGIFHLDNEQINKYFNDLERVLSAFSQNEYISYIYSLVLCDMIRQLSKSLNFVVFYSEICSYALGKARKLCDVFSENKNFYIQLNEIVCVIAIGYAKNGGYTQANQLRNEAVNIKNKLTSNYQIMYWNYLMDLDLSRHGKNFLETEDQLLIYYDSAEEIWKILRKERDIALYFAKTNWEFVLYNDISDGVKISESTIQRMKKNLREIEKDFISDWEIIRYTIAGEDDFLQSIS